MEFYTLLLELHILKNTTNGISFHFIFLIKTINNIIFNLENQYCKSLGLQTIISPKKIKQPV